MEIERRHRPAHHQPVPRTCPAGPKPHSTGSEHNGARLLPPFPVRNGHIRNGKGGPEAPDPGWSDEVLLCGEYPIDTRIMPAQHPCSHSSINSGSSYMKATRHSGSKYSVTLSAPPMSPERSAQFRQALKWQFPDAEFQFESGTSQIVAMKCNANHVNGSKKRSEAKQHPNDCAAILSAVSTWMTATGWWR